MISVFDAMLRLCAILNKSLSGQKHSGEWRNGRRAGFRCQCPSGRGGSSPPSPTMTKPWILLWGSRFFRVSGLWGSVGEQRGCCKVCTDFVQRLWSRKLPVWVSLCPGFCCNYTVLMGNGVITFCDSGKVPGCGSSTRRNYTVFSKMV